MLFAISLLIAGAFSVLCGKALRKHPTPFYLAAAVLSIGTVILANTKTAMPAFLQQNIISLFTKGIFATAFWAVVMWTGALPNQSEIRKKLLPQRGQLSIFAAILTLGHAVGYGISMLPRWIQKTDAVNLIICIGLLLIMLPLTVISVQKIRRKMKAKTWKGVQRWAYLFYALIPLHVIVLNFAKVQRGNTEVRVNLLIYLAVFLGYAVCRVHKWYITKKKPVQKTAAGITALGTFLIGMAVFIFAAYAQNTAKSVQPANVDIIASTQMPAETTAASTKAAEGSGIRETTAALHSDTAIISAGSSETTKTTFAAAETERTDNTALTTASAKSADETTVITAETNIAEETLKTEAQIDPAIQTEPPEMLPPETEPPETLPPETEPPAPVRIYQDGTFTATAYGYDGDITVHVTIENDTITDISAETEESDDSYFIDAKNVVIPAIVRSQATDVDACSGATYSSNGIITAVRAALEQARI